MASSPTQRSLKQLRDDGYIGAVVERWNPFARIRQDLFGFIDLLGIKSGQPLLAIQATSMSNLSSRRTKALALKAMRVWLESGLTFELWGWAKRGPKGKRKLWTLRREVITLADLTNPLCDERVGR